MKTLVVVLIVLFALHVGAIRVEAQVGPSLCGPEPFHACVTKMQCRESEGWVITETEPEGTPCSTTYAGPIDGTCSVSPPRGTIPVSASCVLCTPGTYSVSGTISGLNGSSFVIKDNNGSPLTVSKSPFTFPTKLPNCSNYSVTVTRQPPGGVCTVAHATGRVKNANVTGVSVACSFSPTPPTNTLHTRQDVANLTASQITSLKHGFQVMMENCNNPQVGPNNPACLTYQANIHATEAGEDQCHMGDPNHPLWDQCQHGSYFFLAWHRMYLYYFEKLLRAASGDSSLALPYWNYEASSEQTLPAPFLTPAVDCNGNPAATPGCNPLFLTDRCMNIVGTGFPAPPAQCPDASMSNGNPFTPALPTGAADDSQALMDAAFDPSLGANFGGDAPPANEACHFDSNYGDLELQPHNVIHTDVGGVMANPGTAANDPIFWLHHAEIDHLWKVWLAQGGGRMNPLSDAVWKTTTFSFYDIDTGNIVSKSAQDVLDTVAQLNYRYDDDPEPSSPSPPAPRIEVQTQFPPTPPEELAVSMEQRIELSGGTVHTQLNISPETNAKISHLLEDKEFKHAIVLNLEIDNVRDSSGMHYEIYANLPATEKPARDSIYYVGNLGLFLSRSAETTLRFDLTRSIRAMSDKKAWDGGQLTITFVPRGLLRQENREPLPLRQGVRATIERVSLVAR